MKIDKDDILYVKDSFDENEEYQCIVHIYLKNIKKRKKDKVKCAKDSRKDFNLKMIDF